MGHGFDGLSHRSGRGYGLRRLGLTRPGFFKYELNISVLFIDNYLKKISLY
jgi:hypothetical protein